MRKDEEIHQYWEDQARKNINSSEATNPDTIVFNMEIDFITKHIYENSKILDIGCGNGIKGQQIIKKIKCSYTGIDYSQEMITQANNNKPNNAHINYRVGNVLDENMAEKNSYDIVITNRCLINLTSFEEQKHALKNIHSFLKENGLFLMIENTVDALNNLNNVRKNFGLEDIKIRWHNCYFNENELLNFLDKYFVIKSIDNFASTYYLITRTINAVLNNNNGVVDYNSDINNLSAKLPPLGDYSPMKAFVLLKK